MIKEEWRDIPGYVDSYQVSNLGRVKGLEREVIDKLGRKRMVEEKIRKQRLNTDGRWMVGLSIKDNMRLWNVSQLVAMAFLDHIPNGNTIEVDHKDNDRTNNKLSNLQLLTTRQNSSKSKINRHGYVGVFKTSKSTFGYQIQIKGKHYSSGGYKTAKEAGDAYQLKLKEL